MNNETQEIKTLPQTEDPEDDQVDEIESDEPKELSDSDEALTPQTKAFLEGKEKNLKVDLTRPGHIHIPLLTNKKNNSSTVSGASTPREPIPEKEVLKRRTLALRPINLSSIKLSPRKVVKSSAKSNDDQSNDQSDVSASPSVVNSRRASIQLDVPASPRPSQQGRERSDSTISIASVSAGGSPENKILRQEYLRRKLAKLPNFVGDSPQSGEAPKYDEDKSGLKWNGSFLGEYPLSVLVFTFEHKLSKTRYARLSFDGKEVTCILRASPTAIPCIFDELKPVFKLPKTGTHSIQIGKPLYILQRCHFSKGQIVLEQPLFHLIENEDPILETDEFQEQVRKTFAFRDLLGLTQSSDRNVVVRIDTKGELYPLSLREPKSGILDGSKLADKVIKQWFSKESVSDTVKDMVGWKDEKRKNGDGDDDEAPDVMPRVNHVMKKVEKVIKRIDKSFSGYASFISEKLQSHLEQE